jgi:hypothetical protein
MVKNKKTSLTIKTGNIEFSISVLTSITIMLLLVATLSSVSFSLAQTFEGTKPLNSLNASQTIQVIPTPYVKEYTLPNGTWPNGILVDSGGTVWTVGTKSHTLISFDPINGKMLSSYILKSQDFFNDSNRSRIGVNMVWAMVEGKDGSIWFSQADSSSPLWRFDPTTLKFQTFRSITGAPFQMKLDNNTGNIWFTTFAAGTVGLVQKYEGNSTYNSNQSNYQVTEFPLGKSSYPSGLFLNGDSVWVTQTLDDKVNQFRMVKDAHGKVINILKVLEIQGSENKKLFLSPYDVVALDSRLWITEHDANFITGYDLVSKSATRFAVSSNPHQYISLPFWLREGVNGSGLWFNEHTGNRIAFINTTDLGLTEYEIPTRNPSTGFISNVLNFAVDPQDRNRVWFSEYNYDKIGVINRDIPIPFGIKSVQRNIVMSSSGPAQSKPTTVNIEIIPKPINSSSGSIATGEDTLSFKTSCYMTAFGSLKNITTEFSPTALNLSGLTENIPLQLQLRFEEGKQIASGNYTIGVSATDGTVTRTNFVNLIVK